MLLIFQICHSHVLYLYKKKQYIVIFQYEANVFIYIPDDKRLFHVKFESTALSHSHNLNLKTRNSIFALQFLFKF